jgi:hypothetical protein
MIFFDTIDAHGPQEGVIGIQLFEVGVPNSSMAFDLRIKDFFNRNWCVPLFRENGVENSAAFFLQFFSGLRSPGKFLSW